MAASRHRWWDGRAADTAVNMETREEEMIRAARSGVPLPLPLSMWRTPPASTLIHSYHLCESLNYSTVHARALVFYRLHSDHVLCDPASKLSAWNMPRSMIMSSHFPCCMTLKFPIMRLALVQMRGFFLLQPTLQTTTFFSFSLQHLCQPVNDALFSSNP